MKDIRLSGQKPLIGVTLMSVKANKAHRRRLLTILLEITGNVKFFLIFLRSGSGLACYNTRKE
jgi:dipeptide/tripeptide permease